MKYISSLKEYIGFHIYKYNLLEILRKVSLHIHVVTSVGRLLCIFKYLWLKNMQKLLSILGF